MSDPEFYVGYLPAAPPRLAASVRRIVLGALTGAVVIALALVIGQQPLPTSTFEFQSYKEFQGTLREHPYPMLVSGSPMLLVAPGKHGAAELVRGLDGATVRMKGSLIYRGEDRMIEALPGSIGQFGTSSLPPSHVDLGEVTLAGEIVDSKCYLGVMNPGEGKVHRACAARCISGGIPPALAARDASGATKIILLTGLPIERALEHAAEAVEITGRLSRVDGVLILEADRLARRE